VYAKNVFYLKGRDIYSGHSPPPLGGGLLSILRTGKNLKEDMKKGREKAGLIKKTR